MLSNDVFFSAVSVLVRKIFTKNRSNVHYFLTDFKRLSFSPRLCDTSFLGDFGFAFLFAFPLSFQTYSLSKQTKPLWQISKFRMKTHLFPRFYMQKSISNNSVQIYFNYANQGTERNNVNFVEVKATKLLIFFSGCTGPQPDPPSPYG